MARLSEGYRGEKGQRHQSRPCRGIILQSPMRWPVSSRNGPGLYRERQAGPYVHQWQAAAIPPPNIWNPADDSRVPFSFACNWGGGPLTECDHGTSDEGSLGVEGGQPQDLVHIQQQGQNAFLLKVVCGIFSGTPAETVVPVRWMNEPLPPGMEEKLEQPTCCPSPRTTGTKGKSI